jgi:hypothetical protein
VVDSRFVRQLEQHLKDSAGNLQRVAQQVEKNTVDIQGMLMRDQARQQLDATIKVVTAQYSNARAYANVVIIAGYAAFFAIWGASRNDIPVQATRWALLLMVFSATVFVLYEVVKMIWISSIILRQSNALSAQDGVKRIQMLAESEHTEMKVFGKVWIFALVATLVPGVTAIGMLAVNMLLVLLGGTAAEAGG